jgi:hypothetical protein
MAGISKGSWEAQFTLQDSESTTKVMQCHETNVENEACRNPRA